MTVDEMLATARGRLTRIDAATAATEVGAGALLIDIRPEAQRRRHGEIPGAMVIERNVLEWRLDPTCDARIDRATPDLRVIVVCQEGFTSSLAAASLQELGLAHATDLIGGVSAWAEAGLPMTAGVTAAGDYVPGD